MSVKGQALALAATLPVAAGVIAVGRSLRTAATPTCRPNCASVFSKELGSYAHPGPVEDVLDAVASIDQPVILKQASSYDPP